MKSEQNIERAWAYYEELNGTRSHADWIALIVKILGFLLVRYANGD